MSALFRNILQEKNPLILFIMANKSYLWIK